MAIYDLPTDIYRGTDVSTLLDCDVSIDAFAELYVFIRNRKTGKIAARFSKAGTGDYTKLVKITEYQYQAIWGHSSTKIADLGLYDLDVCVQETNIAYEDSEKDTVTVGQIYNLLDDYSKIVI
jgi:hypothetical protein